MHATLLSYNCNTVRPSLTSITIVVTVVVYSFLCVIFFFLCVFLQPCTTKQIHKVVIIANSRHQLLWNAWFATTSYRIHKHRWLLSLHKTTRTFTTISFADCCNHWNSPARSVDTICRLFDIYSHSSVCLMQLSHNWHWKTAEHLWESHYNRSLCN